MKKNPMTLVKYQVSERCLMMGKTRAQEYQMNMVKALVSAKLDCTVKEFFKACFSNSATNTFFLAQTKASGQTNFRARNGRNTHIMDFQGTLNLSHL